MGSRLTCVLNGIARCMAPSGLKRPCLTASSSAHDGGSASETTIWRGRPRRNEPPPERISERFGEQSEVFEVTKISSKDRTLQRTRRPVS